MTTKAEKDLDTAFGRLKAALSEQDDRPAPAPSDAARMRANLAAHLNRMADAIEGKTAKCPDHPSEKAHNCAICKFGHLEPSTPGQINPSRLPQTPEAARDIDRRILGEGREHRV